MKRLHIIIILLFIIPIFTLGFISIIDEDLTVSIVENRTLSSKPKFSIENVLNSSFMKDGDADKNLDFFYATRPSFCLYSYGLNPPNDFLILFSLYHLMYLSS